MSKQNLVWSPKNCDEEDVAVCFKLLKEKMDWNEIYVPFYGIEIKTKIL